jgi:hypothetical protein
MREPYRMRRAEERAHCETRRIATLMYCLYSAQPLQSSIYTIYIYIYMLVAAASHDSAIGHQRPRAYTVDASRFARPKLNEPMQQQHQQPARLRVEGREEEGRFEGSKASWANSAAKE